MILFTEQPNGSRGRTGHTPIAFNLSHVIWAEEESPGYTLICTTENRPEPSHIIKMEFREFIQVWKNCMK